MFESLNRSNLSRRQCGILRSPSNTRPILWIVEENGVRAVVKDFSVNGFLYRNIVGRLLIRREMKAYRKLEGLNGVPTLYRVIDGLALVVEEIPGRDVEGLHLEKHLPPEFFQMLRDLVESIHERGLAHCDLKRAPNVLLGNDNRPYIVDWSSAIFQRELIFFPLKGIYERFLQDDFNAVVKLQLRHCPEDIRPEALKRYHYRSRSEKLIRRIRDRAREILQKMA